MSSRNTEFTVTFRRSTEAQGFYVGQTATGLVSIVGTITAMENAPEWLESTESLAAVLTGPEAYMKPIVEGIIAQYDKQIAQGITDPVVDGVFSIGRKHVPMPAFGINPSDGTEGANIILQGFELVCIERGTSVTMSTTSMAAIAAKAQEINDNKNVRAFDDSMARRAARTAASTGDVAKSTTRVINKPAAHTPSSAL